VPGPLAGCRVVEMAAVGPVPFAGMMLADYGADVVRVDRTATGEAAQRMPGDPLSRGRRSIAVDLKHPDGAAVVLSLVGDADILLEGHRPGVMERLGLGPEPCLERNPALIYGRMTGWGQDGPYSHAAGHDINYIAVAGVLHHLGRPGTLPTPPLNLVGDFGGGAMFLLAGVLAALYESRASGVGQIVDASMVDGAALLMASIYGVRAEGRWNDQRGSNLIDSGAPFYDVYETQDGQLVSVGALERPFYQTLLRICEVEERWPNRFDPSGWPQMRDELAAAFRSRSLEEWCERFEGSDACFAPVRSMTNVLDDPHIAARGTFTEVQGVIQPTPSPRLSRTPAPAPQPGPSRVGEHTDQILEAARFDKQTRDRLRAEAVVA
jgi:alpha-methylacyl-CoA racemase